MNRRQKLIIAEVAVGFALIMLYIWRLRFTAPRAWVLIMGFFILSHTLRGERAARLGFRTNNFRECLRTMAPALLLLTLALIAGGVLVETIRPISPEYGLMCLLAYCPWGIFQQYLLNGYIANRLLAVSSTRYVPLIAASLFGGAHLPNWFLMLVTFAAGYYSTKIFMRYRNLYFLGLAHAVIGTLLFVVVPDSISHHLTVGPGFFSRIDHRGNVPDTTRVVKAGTPVESAIVSSTLISAPAARALPPLTYR
ncbi:MAG: CPBP family intramembrane glutamic endopeptidase [Bryobacteraceae bacterium]